MGYGRARLRRPLGKRCIRGKAGITRNGLRGSAKLESAGLVRPLPNARSVSMPLHRGSMPAPREERYHEPAQASIRAQEPEGESGAAASCAFKPLRKSRDDVRLVLIVPGLFGAQGSPDGALPSSKRSFVDARRYSPICCMTGDMSARPEASFSSAGVKVSRLRSMESMSYTSCAGVTR